MATNNTKSAAITGLDASPLVRANAWIHGGNLKHFTGLVEGGGTDSAGTTFRFFRVPSWMRIATLNLGNDAGGTSAKVDIGFYRIAAEGGAAVHTSILASAVSIATARPFTNVLYTSSDGAATKIDQAEKRIWELLGLTSDPNLEYDVVATVVDDVDNAATYVLNGSFG